MALQGKNVGFTFAIRDALQEFWFRECFPVPNQLLPRSLDADSALVVSIDNSIVIQARAGSYDGGTSEDGFGVEKRVSWVGKEQI